MRNLKRYLHYIGGSNSYLYELNRQNRIQDSENYLKKYMSVAKGNLLLEINNFEDQNFALAKRTIFSLASKLKIPVIGTNDCMFLNKETLIFMKLKFVLITVQHLMMQTDRVNSIPIST